MAKHHTFAQLRLSKSAQKQIRKALAGASSEGDPDCFEANNGKLVLHYKVHGRKPVKVEIANGSWEQS